MDQVTEHDIKFSYWLLTHREQLRRFVIIVLTLLATGFISYSLWQWVDYLTSRNAEEQAIAHLVGSNFNSDYYRQTLAPMDIEVGTVTAVPTGNGIYDLVAEIKNPNFKWAAKEIPFSFTVGDAVVEGKTFLLPLEDKYAVSLAAPIKIKPSKIDFEIGAVKWMRIADLSSLRTPSFDIANQNIEALVADDGSKRGSQLTFDLINTSPYSFWQATVTVVLTNGRSIQAVGQQLVTNVNSQGTQRLEFRWPFESLRADNLVVKGEVNVLDPRVFR